MKRILILTMTLSIFFIACHSDKNNNFNNKGNNDSISNSVKNLDNYAKLLSGLNCDKFADIQKKEFYKNFQRSISTTWNYFYLNQLTVISNWAVSNNITSKNDTLPVFYPFSGPDLPFVYSFYPYSKSYIFIGLENIGKIPQFENYSDLEIDSYINSLSSSMTDYFLYGYFSTQILKTSFRSSDMNGVVHPLVFFVYRINQTIESMQYFVLDQYGKIQYVNFYDPLIKRIKGVEFKIKGENGEKTLYYLQLDLSNQNFSDYPEFYTFISNFGPKNVFIKSASYLLQDSKFSDFRNLLVSQSVKILQDDSGLSFGLLSNDGFNIKLFGNYAHTLNIFSKYYQKDLKDAYDKQKPQKLPFRFGYNIPFDQTTLIFATKFNKNDSKYPFYSIQFKMSWNKLNGDSLPNSQNFIDYYFDEGYYKYISGEFKDLQQSREHLDEIKAMGYKDAFIVQFFKDKKVIIQ